MSISNTLKQGVLCAAVALGLAVASPAAAHVDLHAPDGAEVLVAGSVFTVEWEIEIRHDLQNWPVVEGTHQVAAAKQERVAELVERMRSLNTDIDAAKTPTEKTAVQRQIDATDRQIDQLVYELYGLNDEEIRIVEESAQS